MVVFPIRRKTSAKHVIVSMDMKSAHRANAWIKMNAKCLEAVRKFVKIREAALSAPVWTDFTLA